jgi:hypothetical protein
VKKGADAAATAGRRGGDDTKKGLEKGPKAAKANLSLFNGSIRVGIGTARSTASSGGTQVGAAMKSGTLAGVSGLGAILAAQLSAAVAPGIAAA